MAISLAPLRYMSVFAERGGPLARLTVVEGRSSSGAQRHLANAYLQDSLRPSWYEEKRLYVNADGSGTHRLRNAACHIAISEALERWAFYAECEGSRRAEFGFDQDPSTTGMAAFPGLRADGARARASLEALERWSVVEWWEGMLPARIVRPESAGEGALEIRTPLEGGSVMVVWRRCSFGGLAFGFSAGSTPREALEHARVEQDRNIVVLENALGHRGKSPEAVTVPLEKRLVFFASEQGETLFRANVARTCALRALPPAPRTLVDREIPGPWSKYAAVWRMLYEQSTEAHLDDNRNDFFLF